jgi:hypothetical protein
MMEMKNKLVMKTASWTLSLALIAMSPGVNCYAAMAEMSNGGATGTQSP